MILTGDALTQLHTLPDASVDCCITSPPYYGLRDYGVEGQIGLEETPEEYIDRLVEVFREVKRVLKDSGTLWVNIGDSYAGSCKGGGCNDDYFEKKACKQASSKGSHNPSKALKSYTNGEIKEKDLIGIPWMLAFALRADGWYLRQDIIWQKQNPMPEPVQDRCTKSHEYIFLLSKSRYYYYDADAIKEPAKLTKEQAEKRGAKFGGKKYAETDDVHNRTKSGNLYASSGYRNKRDVWSVSTSPYRGAHFATFPPKLIEPCVLAGCPENGVVIDPFFGAGTTGLVAAQFGRDYIGIELNPEYVRIAEKRLSEVQMRFA